MLNFYKTLKKNVIILAKEAYVPGSFSAKSKAKEIVTSLTSNFDKSVLQIMDWLSLERETVKNNTVTVGDVDLILESSDKLKNILHELEYKKPQLDELVHSAEALKMDMSRQQLQAKGRRNLIYFTLNIII